MTTPELLKGPPVGALARDAPDNIGGRLPGNRFRERDTDEVITFADVVVVVVGADGVFWGDDGEGDGGACNDNDVLLDGVAAEAAIVIVDFPAGVRTGMMIFFGATTVRAIGGLLVGIVLVPSLEFSLPEVVSANRAPEQAAESSSSRWVLLRDLLLVVLLLRLLATEDRLVVRRLLNMEAGLPPRILLGADWPLLLLVVLQPDSLSTPSSSGWLECWIGLLPAPSVEAVVEVW